ncbi:unnamed protein product [[Candida] boidinii]|nr:unnamed protein product [[Candida] boidinii]
MNELLKHSGSHSIEDQAELVALAARSVAANVQAEYEARDSASHTDVDMLAVQQYLQQHPLNAEVDDDTENKEEDDDDDDDENDDREEQRDEDEDEDGRDREEGDDDERDDEEEEEEEDGNEDNQDEVEINGQKIDRKRIDEAIRKVQQQLGISDNQEDIDESMLSD